MRTMMMMEMFLRRKKFTVRRPTDWRRIGSFDTFSVVVFLFRPTASTFRLLFLRHCTLTNDLVFTFTPGTISRCVFLSPLVFIFTEAISFPVEFASNVFSFLLMQVFYVFLVVRVDAGWGCESYSCLHCSECWFKMLSINNNISTLRSLSEL